MKKLPILPYKRDKRLRAGMYDIEGVNDNPTIMCKAAAHLQMKGATARLGVIHSRKAAIFVHGYVTICRFLPAR